MWISKYAKGKTYAMLKEIWITTKFTSVVRV
jgi:hypothetical protein